MPEQVGQVSVRRRLRRRSRCTIALTDVGTLMVFCRPAIGVFQRDAQVIAQVGAARSTTAAAAAAAAHEIAEQIVENIGKG